MSVVCECGENLEQHTAGNITPDLEYGHTPMTSNPHNKRATAAWPDSVLSMRSTTWGVRPEKSAKPDGKLHWCDIAVPCEWKKGDQQSDLKDNSAKVIWHMHHILRDDPCRRFIYGLTIGNKECVLWFANRERIVASKAFDFIENPDTFMRILVTFAQSNPSQLGYDPTMKRVNTWNAENSCFEITVHGDDNKVEKFRTKKLISSVGTHDLFSRGTRVWEVTKVGDESGESYVLKDTWIDSARPKEGWLHRELLGNVSEDDQKYFLKPQIHGQVMVDAYDGPTGTVKTCPDTTALHRNGVSLDEGTVLNVTFVEEISIEPTNSSHSLLANTPPNISDKPAQQKNIERDHYRTVNKGLGTSMLDLRNRRDMLEVLISASEAVQVVHKAGWLVRDVSPANIIAIKTQYGYQAKLIDYGYYKREEDTEAYNARTGTPDTMSVEVELGAWRHITKTKQSRRITTGSDFAPQTPPFFSTKLHDIESLWWHMPWILVRFLSDADKDWLRSQTDPKAALELLRTLDSHLFKNRFQRAPLFQELDLFPQKLFACYKPDSHPLTKLTVLIENTRMDVVQLFIDAEAKVIKNEKGEPTFATMDQVCAEAAERWLRSLKSVGDLDQWGGVDREPLTFFTSSFFAPEKGFEKSK